MKNTIKLLAANAICHPAVGNALSAIYRGKIPDRGFVIDTHNKHIGARNVAALYWGLYEKAEINYIRQYLRNDLDVIEVGSSMGVVSLHIIRKQQPGRKLICVEANPYLIETIKSNLKTNAPEVKVEVLNRAISYGDGPKVNFSVAEDTLVSSIDGSNGKQSVAVESSTLSELLREYNVEEFALVSDIEGAEAGFILNDAQALLRCRQMIIELHDTEYEGKKYSIEELRERIESIHGFKLIAYYGGVHAFER